MKRPLAFKPALFVFFTFLIGMICQAQSGKVSGTILDADGLPLPGVNIVVQGKSVGTQTNFDGDYSIKCDIGDVLVISFIGQQTRELKVISSMFDEKQIATAVKKVLVETVLDTTYQNLVRKNLPSFLVVPSLEESPKTHNGKRFINAHRIKNISTNGNKVAVAYYDPDIYFEVGLSSAISMQFIKANNLPQIQNTFAQGSPVNGSNTQLGPETGTIFSYGPRLSSLEFDGSNYPFDPNGRLVSNGEGNGKDPIAYNNKPFENIIKTSTNLFFNIATDDHFLGFDFLNKSGKDIYDAERSHQNEFDLSLKNLNGYNAIEWGVQFKHITSTENQPNINGFQNNLLFNALVSPTSFSNAQSYVLQDGSQRSFSPSNYNNPLWLLNSNRNQLDNDLWLGSLSGEFDIARNASVNSFLSYTLNNSHQKFGVYRNTVGFIDGYSSDKQLTSDVFNSNINLDWNPDIGYGNLEISTFGNYINENLKYSLIERTDFSDRTFNTAQNSSSVENDLTRATFRWQTKLDYQFLNHQARATLINNAYTSTLQNSKWFLPTVQLEYEFARGWLSDFLRSLKLSASFGYDVIPTNLFYDNQSHNSLRLNLEESLSYTTNNDLFATNTVDLEEKKGYEINLDFRFQLFNKFWNLKTTHYSNTTNGSVFPVWENNRYQLLNIANVQDSGVEWTFDAGTYRYDGFQFHPRIVFSSYRTKVLALLSTENRIPIAGFSSISKNLIKGEPAGVIVGSAYAKDEQNRRIIDSEGFPIVNPEAQLIGDPTPDFNLGFSGTLQWKRFQLDFVFDYQKGGDLWNGTQNVLNYFGASQQSALTRNTENSVFSGVTEQGTTNTTPVDFANPANGLEGNRYVRYGFEGVGEEAIVDGSYLNFKSVNLSYEFHSDKQDPFFRQFKVGIYGTNLFTTSKFQGRSPYSSLYNHSSSQGINFFNSPLLSEIGMKINIKI